MGQNTPILSHFGPILGALLARTSQDPFGLDVRQREIRQFPPQNLSRAAQKGSNTPILTHFGSYYPYLGVLSPYEPL